MQQAPEYQEQGQLRREYIPQQPNPVYQGQQAPGGPAAVNRQVGPLSWSDWVRWGPIWSGFFTIISTLAILGALGAGIALTAWGPNPSTAFNYAWLIFTGVVAYFLGGFVTARAAGVGGAGPAMLNGGLAWALSLVAILGLVIIGAGNVVGFIGNNLYLLLHTSVNGVTPSQVTGTLAETAWITFASLVIGLILAIVGGLAGARNLSTRWSRRTV
jgi:hypothetical protein